MSLTSIAKTVLGAAAAACLIISTAEAAPINTSFSLTGAFNPAPGTHLGTTTGFFVDNGGEVTISEAGSLDLAAFLPLGTLGTLQDIPSFAGFTPIDDFFSINGVTFDLNTFTVVSQFGPAPGFIIATGTGVLSAPGFDDTVGAISLTGVSVDNLVFTFGITASANAQPVSEPVPEPFSLGLLCLGLMGAYAGRRKFAKASV